jgi:hypothetical protein
MHQRAQPSTTYGRTAMRHRGSNSSPLAAAALLLVLLLVASCFHCAAAVARHLPSPVLLAPQSKRWITKVRTRRRHTIRLCSPRPYRSYVVAFVGLACFAARLNVPEWNSLSVRSRERCQGCISWYRRRRRPCAPGRWHGQRRRALLHPPRDDDDGSGGVRGGERQGRVRAEAAAPRRAPRLHLHAAQGQAVTVSDERTVHAVAAAVESEEWTSSFLKPNIL